MPFHPLNPEINPTERAMVRGVGKYGNKDRIGVFGYSEERVGVWADSDNVGLYAVGTVLAGEFDGQVKVSGNTEVTGSLTVHGLINNTQIESILNRLSELEGMLSTLERLLSKRNPLEP